MKSSVTAVVKIMTVSLALASIGVPGGSRGADVKNFNVFNAIGYAGTPDLSKYNIEPLDLIYEASLNNPPASFSHVRRYSTAKVREAANSAEKRHGALVILDMETWGWNAGAIQQYAKAIREFKSTDRSDKVGMFGVLSTHGYLLYNSFSKNHPELVSDWKQQQLIAAPILGEVDVLALSGYTMGADAGAWEKEIKFMVKNARHVAPGKPVYVFLWPQYYAAHAGCKAGSIQAKPLPAGVWRNELETAYAVADGVILWSPPWACSDASNSVEHPEFSVTMPWFVETLDFMKAHSIN